MEYFNIVIKQIFIFIIYALIGVIAVKKNVFDEKGLQVISNLIIKITLPIMLFCNTINGATKRQFIDMMPILMLTVLMYFLLYFICYGLKLIFKLEGIKGEVYRASTMFGNVGFMGIPILVALFPDNAMIYIALFTVVDQLLLWTLGVKLTSKDSGDTSVFKRLEKLVNPATIAIVLAIIFIFGEFKLPLPINTALEKVGNITSPLAMIYLGGLFCYINIKTSFKQKEYYAAVVMKMCLFPILFYLLIGYIPGVSSQMRLSMAILSALPTMSSVAMLAKSQESEGEYSASQVFLTTSLSIITLPTVCYIISIL